MLMPIPEVSLNSSWNPCEALTAIAVGAAQADGSVLACEADRLEHSLSSLPVFRTQSAEARRAIFDSVARRLRDADPSRFLNEAADAIPSELRGAAFAISVDVLLADGRMRASELQFLEELRRLLHVRRSFAQKVVEVLRTKNLA